MTDTDHNDFRYWNFQKLRPQNHRFKDPHGQTHSRIHLEIQGTQNRKKKKKKNLKNSKFRKLTLPSLKTYYKATAIETVTLA